MFGRQRVETGHMIGTMPSTSRRIVLVVACIAVCAAGALAVVVVRRSRQAEVQKMLAAQVELDAEIAKAEACHYRTYGPDALRSWRRLSGRIDLSVKGRIEELQGHLVELRGFCEHNQLLFLDDKQREIISQALDSLEGDTPPFYGTEPLSGPPEPRGTRDSVQPRTQSNAH
jgi:hypothetical protein